MMAALGSDWEAPKPRELLIPSIFVRVCMPLSCYGAFVSMVCSSEEQGCAW
jgi:hypothetical protein